MDKNHFKQALTALLNEASQIAGMEEVRKVAAEVIGMRPGGMNEPTGCIIEARVLQSDLYAKLDERERAECDHFIAVGQWKSLDQQGKAVAHRHLHEDGWEYYDAPTGEDCKDCQKLYTHPQADPKLADECRKAAEGGLRNGVDYCGLLLKAAAALGGGK
jgi:hypothetical protein